MPAGIASFPLVFSDIGDEFRDDTADLSSFGY